jgi:uncharacterized peroxidase-related enzyme
MTARVTVPANSAVDPPDRAVSAPQHDAESPRVPLLGQEEAPPSVRALFESFRRTRGNIPNLFRAVASRPPIVETLFAHLQAVMGPGTVNTLLKELLAVRVSQANGCDYCLASHSALVKRLGGTDEQIAQAGRNDYTAFDPAWAAALEYAAAVAAPGGHVSDATYASLAKHWEAPQIVEITAVCAAFSLFNRFANALRIPITR